MKRALKILFETVIYAAIVFGIVWGVPKFLSVKLGTEYPIAAITSGSMWPALKQNDIVLIKKIPKEELKIGDIVVWQNQQGFTIHRITELASTTLTTKGDANFTSDNPVPYSDIVGRTVMLTDTKPLRIPYFGYISVIGGKYRGKKAEANGDSVPAQFRSPTEETPGTSNRLK